MFVANGPPKNCITLSPADYEGMVADASVRVRHLLYISQFVLDEAAAGDPQASGERMAALQGLPLLDLTDEVVNLAGTLKTSLALPEKAVTDAAHIAIAAVHGMHFLLTWNCAHIANAEMFVAIGEACQERGFSCPVICTPEELMGV
jgi:hypothetical protein